jgi:hypothetical protein
MGTAIGFEDVVVEVLDPQAKAGHAEPANYRELGLGERPGLALEGNLLRGVPRRYRGEAFDQPLELLRGQEGRRTAPEIHEIERPTSNRRRPRQALPLAGQRLQVLLHLLRVLVGVDPEVTEVTPLPAERDVQVEAERHASWRRPLERRPRVSRDRLGRPYRERRIGSDEIAADAGVVANRSGIRHAAATISARRASSSAEIERFPVERGLESLPAAVTLPSCPRRLRRAAGLRPANDDTTRRRLRRFRHEQPATIIAAGWFEFAR